MVSYSADQTLIQGAKDLGKSMMPADLSGLDKVITAGKDMAVGVLDERRKVAQEKVDANDLFTEAANQVELASGALGDVLYNDTVDFAQAAKNEYLTALKADDQKGMMAAKKAMIDRSTFTQNHKKFTTELADLQKNGNLSSTHTKGENGFMTAVLKGNYKLGKNEKGEMTFDVTDQQGNTVSKTNAEFEDMYILKNFEVGKTIGELNIANKKSQTFDRNATMNSLAQVIPKTLKEFRAALADDIGGAKNFGALLNEDDSLVDEIQAALGEQGLAMFDTDETPGLSEDEKLKFIEAITDHNNPNFNLENSRAIMTEKLVNAVENNHTEHWKKVGESNEAIFLQKQIDQTNSFLEKKKLQELKYQLEYDNSEQGKKDKMLKNSQFRLNQLNSSSSDELKEIFGDVDFKAITQSDLKLIGLPNDVKLDKIIDNQLQFYRDNVSKSADVRHFTSDEVKKAFGDKGYKVPTGTSGASGYYRFVENDNGDVIPTLIQEGYNFDPDNLAQLMNYEKGIVNPFAKGKGDLDTND